MITNTLLRLMSCVGLSGPATIISWALRFMAVGAVFEVLKVVYR